MKHQVEFINSHNEIEKNNKKFIPYAEGGEVIVHKARVIAPDKSIMTLDESKFIESIDEQSGVKHKYFAFEGIEQGSIIEYYYVIKKRPSYNGKLRYFQFDAPVLDYKFELYSPPVHVFDFNFNNHDGEVKKDSVVQTKNRWYFEAENLPALIEEEYSPYNSLRKQLIYKLSENKSSGKLDISSYGFVCQNIFANVYNIEQKEEKTLEKISTAIAIKPSDSEETMIRKIENYCKDNIRISEASTRELANIADIEKNKMASKFGMLKLLANVFKLKGIGCEIVLTSDRMNHLFDPDFESYHNLGEYFMYFKSINKYLDPNDNAYRLGFIPFQFTDNYGLFIREYTVNNFTTGLGEIKYIHSVPHTYSTRNITVKAELDPDELNTKLAMSTLSTGYNALYMQYALEIIPQENREEMIQDNFKGLLKEIQIKDWTVENDKANLFGVKPAIMSCNADCPNLVQRAGNKLLFKIGELIGPQLEMYNDTARQLPMHSFFKRMYEHKLEIEIPEGYKVKNLDAIKIDKKHVINDVTILQFVSDYTLDGNRLVVSIDEFYKQISFEADEIDFYREVVNGASDFNKVVLVLERQD